MGRLLFILVIIVLLWWLIASYRRKSGGDVKEPVSQEMVRCAYCGVHLPKSESVQKDGKYYCCTLHSQEKSE